MKSSRTLNRAVKSSKLPVQSARKIILWHCGVNRNRGKSLCKIVDDCGKKRAVENFARVRRAIGRNIPRGFSARLPFVRLGEKPCLDTAESKSRRRSEGEHLRYKGKRQHATRRVARHSGQASALRATADTPEQEPQTFRGQTSALQKQKTTRDSASRAPRRTGRSPRSGAPFDRARRREQAQDKPHSKKCRSRSLYAANSLEKRKDR